ncbi:MULTISPECIES: helix-turn-helix domain-containing protein [unclassified Nonomuraea]|uniref:TetR/AcrR family transcriptional regulator n=1 Tax=unclassified Nonomuraea TaxID=2593643 RepID=UPI0033E3AC8A
MESPEQRRERRRAEKRQAIRLAAVRLALDEGLDAVTVEAVSAAADISPRTFFNYFASKEEALVMEPVWRPDDIVAMLADRPADEPAFRSLKAVARELAVRVRPIWDTMQPFMELNNRYPELAARARAVDQTQIMETVLGAVRARPGVTSGIHARMLLITTFGAMISAIQESAATEKPVEELLDEAFALLERGL